jgi:DNA helicase-2/ATP-dependent DNA helicase PcrA
VALVRELADAVATLDPGALVLHIATRTGYWNELEREDTDESRDRLRNIEELASAVAVTEGETATDRLLAFLDRATLSGQSDELPDADAGAVTLLTAHLAKGLEFPFVFIVGMNEGTFPLSRSEREDDLEEERRLAYVAITRARERLYVSASRRRWANTEGGRRSVEVGPSPFLHEVPRTLFDHPPFGQIGISRSPEPRGWTARPSPPVKPWGLPPSRPAPRAEAPSGRRRLRPENADAYREGVEVFHATMGIGTILRREGTAGGLKLTISFTAHGSRTVFAASAGLDILLP